MKGIVHNLRDIVFYMMTIVLEDFYICIRLPLSCNKKIENSMISARVGAP